MSYVTDRAKKLGIPIMDGMSPLVITVTHHDVVNALKSDSKRCALSRASERIAGVVHGYFFRTLAYLEYRGRMVRYILPPSVQKEIVSFDRAQVFASGIYQLSPPGSYSERRRNRDRSGELARLKALRDNHRTAKSQTSRKYARRPAEALPKYAFTAISGDQHAADFMEKMAAVTQRALDGKGAAPYVGRATKQPKAAPRQTLINRVKYVRDIRDPDAVRSR
jgi:hypothetical protein